MCHNVDLITAVLGLILRIRTDEDGKIITKSENELSFAEKALKEQFERSNKNNGWSLIIPSIKDTAMNEIRCNNKPLNLYLVKYQPDDRKRGATPVQMQRINIQSAYRVGVDEHGFISSNGFIDSYFLETNYKDLKGEDLIEFIKNMRSLFTNYITFVYPEINNQNTVYQYASNLAITTLRMLEIPILPSDIVSAYGCTTQVAEDILDKYDLKGKRFIGVPWAS